MNGTKEDIKLGVMHHVKGFYVTNEGTATEPSYHVWKEGVTHALADSSYSDISLAVARCNYLHELSNPTTEEVNKFLNDNYPTKSICRRGGCSNVKKKDKTYCIDCSYEKIMTGY